MSFGGGGMPSAAALRAASILQKSKSDAKGLSVADELMARGNIRLASNIYSRLSLTRPPNASTGAAKQKLTVLQAEASKKLAELDKKLKAVENGEDVGDENSAYASLRNDRVGDDGKSTRSDNNNQTTQTKQPIAGAAADAKGSKDNQEEDDDDDEVASLWGDDSSSTSVNTPPSPSANASSSTSTDISSASASSDSPSSSSILMNARLRFVFDEYSRIVRDYGELPRVGSQIKAHVGKLRKRPEYAAVLNEPEARELWEVGQKHERDDQLCCAYWAYKEAATLTPAPSAELAKARFAELENDPKVKATAEQCRELKKCHKDFLLAQKLWKVKPERAREIFDSILKRAPHDSKIYIETKKYLD